ncbi:MAG: TonB-dependent receptor [Cyclobacteriaceae bacterium]|nr:carboxypeptidase-like regulatory domain-containing protein [Cyclobacteriaceae bacterium]MCH8515413.1 TonB-dependent receptor [Cyclobacteriaceae bacterium]
MKYIYKTLIFSLLFFVLLVMSLHSTHAQVTLSGRLVDRESGDAIEFANVALLSPEDSSVVTGAQTNLDGNFKLKAERGEYILRAGFVGYGEHYEKVRLRRSAKKMGKIALVEESKLLEEVEIEATEPLFDNDIDKRTFNVENSIVSEGGTAVELMETLPSVQVDEDGNIAMRGSGDILIYIDARPTNLTADDTEGVLGQFPANTIESVELITNPSSKYDAEGVGGIS